MAHHWKGDDGIAQGKIGHGREMGSDVLQMNERNHGARIWIDLDNSPHVPFFIPIAGELERRGHRVFLTTRDAFQVCSLADHFGLDHKRIGRHYGANKLAKVFGTLLRSVQLAPYVLRVRPRLSMSHGSRSLVILSSILRIPTILMFDYEFARIVPFFKADLGLAPESIGNTGLASNFKHGLRHFSGLKEDVYVSSYLPGPSVRTMLGIAEDDILVTIRPPATEAHYHNPESDRLFEAVIDFLGIRHDARMVILPRNEKTQRDYIFRTWPELCEQRRIVVPDKVLNGLDLIWQSDLVISGGGTMNREAASLGVPVYSIFRGKLGAVDRYLAQEGRLTLIETEDDVTAKIKVERRSKEQAAIPRRPALTEIVNSIEEMLERG